MLYATFTKEREAAVRVAEAGGVSESEQLVWVLYKILKGDGDDVSLSLILAYAQLALNSHRTYHRSDRSLRTRWPSRPCPRS